MQGKTPVVRCHPRSFSSPARPCRSPSTRLRQWETLAKGLIVDAWYGVWTRYRVYLYWIIENRGYRLSLFSFSHVLNVCTEDILYNCTTYPHSNLSHNCFCQKKVKRWKWVGNRASRRYNIVRTSVRRYNLNLLRIIQWFAINHARWMNPVRSTFASSCSGNKSRALEDYAPRETGAL